eukprot:Plantae.Rhodophyta-Purpureofilum_apyrenoidigerum.ctg17297.p2 GENE.Plantae.Rhodophyta-Purpureofilum_apyrenoidigerum.ctg17297~~Plantae.Rhodophyta-Purpureofilum_apyrenoidigerum.ctg17297.p2  ORF type:complete len:313 (-),score=60.26 Plantae.Rhodophyta-Purpureofilum_apyrenoidigerum.ctg17297:106-1044(-)
MSAFLGSFVGLGAPRSYGLRVARERRSAVRRTRAERVTTVSAALGTARWAGKDQQIDIDGIKISFDYFPGEGPVVVFLPQFFYSKDPFAKVNSIMYFCERRRQGFLTLDYYGTGRSGGKFKDGTLSMWVNHVIEILERVLGTQKVMLVTTGVGVWIGMHVAMRRSKQIIGIVGMSVDPDFTEELILPSMTDEQKQIMKSDGVVEIEWGQKKYPIGQKFIDDAKNMLVLRKGPNSINVDCPVRLLQGMSDEEIPFELALKLATNLRSKDVKLTYLKESDHTMEREADFELMTSSTAEILNKYYEFDLGTPGSG